jgi:hypothetical protein
MSIVNDSSPLFAVGKRDATETKQDFSRERRTSFFTRWFYHSLSVWTVAQRDRVLPRTVDDVIRQEVGKQLQIHYERGYMAGRRSTLPPVYMRRAAA